MKAKKCYNMTRNIIRIITRNITRREGLFIKRLTTEKKLWLEKRNRKIQRRKRMKNEKKHTSSREISKQFNSVSANNVKKFTFPKIFSIVDNSKETLKIFHAIDIEKNNGISNTDFLFDFQYVEKITVDALMYLIAIISDYRLNISMKYTFSGNFPQNDVAKKVFIESGFLDFVDSSISDIYPKNANIKICSNTISDPQKAKEVCCFIKDKCNLSASELRPLYCMIIEMMNNTIQHAYTDVTYNKAKNWYMYAEYVNSSVMLVFLDTGLSIPKTIYTKLGEKLKYIFKQLTDCDLIKSALDGDFRTQTKQRNRGKGLPQISSCFRNHLLSNVFICSRLGVCKLTDGSNYNAFNNSHQLNGTLYSWTIKKKG